MTEIRTEKQTEYRTENRTRLRGNKMKTNEENGEKERYTLSLEKQGYSEVDVISKVNDWMKRNQFKYVKVANPFVLGMQIGIGIFIVLPLLILVILMILAVLGISILSMA